MVERKRGGAWFTSAAIAGVVLAAGPVAAQDGGYRALLTGNGGALCGPCEPAPMVTCAPPDSPVVALRYRWSADAARFELISEQEVGVTDERGELRFRLEQGAGVDKIAVRVGDVLSDGFVFETHGECAGPRLCPLPRRFHVFANASAYLRGQAVVATVSGGAPGRLLDVTAEQYVGKGEGGYWIPAGKPVLATVDAGGHATAGLRAGGPGAYRVVARDLETGEESGVSLFEVGEPY
jgi:hypothetical protein